jgi:hypothetical protein
MKRLARMVGLIVLLAGLGLGGGGSAAREPEPEAVLWEVGTSPACDFSTIEAAIAAAGPGDTIKVENTVFDENPLTINKNLTLKGGYNYAGPVACLTLTGFNHTIVHRSGTTPDPILRLDGADVTITWFIFEGNANEAGLEVDGATLDLQNSIVRDNHFNGMYIHTGSDVILNSAEISDNSAGIGGGLWIGGGSHVVADNTVIKDNSGSTDAAGVYVRQGSTFTARNGSSIEHNRTVLGCNRGGGIFATGPGTEVLIDASHVISNTALERGGGLYLEEGAVATIQNFSWIQENGTYGPAVGGGGGVHVDGSGGDTTLNVYGSMFYLNWSDPDGAAIWNEFGTVYMDGGILINNNAAQRGGALFTSLGPATVLDSFFIGNVASYNSGGGIATYRSELSVHRSYFKSNTSDLEGSAIYVQGANGAFEPAAEIVNCYLVDNTPTALSSEGLRGGGPYGSTLYVEGTEAAIIHNTLAHETQLPHIGVYVGDGSTLKLMDNIITGFDTGIRRPSLGTGTATSDYDLFWNNWLHFDASGVTVLHPVYGNPAFVSPPNNYHITAASWALDMGADAGVYVDYDGDFRPWLSGFDIGADEWPDRERVYLPFVRR